MIVLICFILAISNRQMESCQEVKPVVAEILLENGVNEVCLEQPHAVEPVKSKSPSRMQARPTEISRVAPPDEPRSWVGGRNWILGRPSQIVFVAGFVFYIAFRFFRQHSPHHEAGCVVAVVLGLTSFVLHVAVGLIGQSSSMLLSVMTMAGFGYSFGAAGSWFKSLYEASQSESRAALSPERNDIPISEQLAKLQNDLDGQLKTLDQTPFDNETKEDLKEAARMGTVERMAKLLEDFQSDS